MACKCLSRAGRGVAIWWQGRLGLDGEPGGRGATWDHRVTGVWGSTWVRQWEWWGAGAVQGLCLPASLLCGHRVGREQHLRQGSGGLCRPRPGPCTSTPSRCLFWEPLARLPSLRYPRAAPAQVTPCLLRTAGWPVPARLSFCELRAHSCVLGTRWTPGGHPWSIAFIGRQMLSEAGRAIGLAWAQQSVEPN